ncbi:MAG TPA: primosomal protein N', partial [Stellaceae bacterium]|nr:primosomal protein N' [Stellaceae bacterium]
MPDRHASSRAVADHAASVLDTLRVSVLLPLPLAGAYDYLAPRDMALRPGDFVAAPLGRNQSLGVVWGDAAGDVAPPKLKRVMARLDAPPMPESLRRLVDWLASYTVSPPGAVLRMAMSVPEALHPGRAITGYALTDAGRAALAAGTALTPARRRVLEALADGPPA